MKYVCATVLARARNEAISSGVRGLPEAFCASTRANARTAACAAFSSRRVLPAGGHDECGAVSWRPQPTLAPDIQSDLVPTGYVARRQTHPPQSDCLESNADLLQSRDGSMASQYGSDTERKSSRAVRSRLRTGSKRTSTTASGPPSSRACRSSQHRPAISETRSPRGRAAAAGRDCDGQARVPAGYAPRPRRRAFGERVFTWAV
jgi:hypothetical protein